MCLQNVLGLDWWENHILDYVTSFSFPFFKSVFCMSPQIHIMIPPTGYVGLILRSTAVTSASRSNVEGTMRVLCSYCMCSSFSAFCHSSIRVPS